MADYITGIAPTKFEFWIEYAEEGVLERLQAWWDDQGNNGYDEGDLDEDLFLYNWVCEEIHKKRSTDFYFTSPDYSTKLAIRCWCDRACEAIKTLGGDPDELQWLVAARNMEFEPLTFTGATNGVWDGDEKTGFAKFREMFSGDK